MINDELTFEVFFGPRRFFFFWVLRDIINDPKSYLLFNILFPIKNKKNQYWEKYFLGLGMPQKNWISLKSDPKLFFQ